MAHAAETLERAEHMSHAGGGHGHGAGQGDRLSMYIGITMAILSVLLAFTASRVGFERAELVQYMVDQEHAHLKYQSHDIKHYMALLNLQQMHAETSKTEDMIALAKSAKRFQGESVAAKAWADAYDPIVAAHSEAQEEYEHAQLAAEIGIVMASIALLLKRRAVWGLALILGLVSVVMTTTIWKHTAHVLESAEEKAEHAEKAYHELRHGNKDEATDDELVEAVMKLQTEAVK
jgi:hypothetical protein